MIVVSLFARRQALKRFHGDDFVCFRLCKPPIGGVLTDQQLGLQQWEWEDMCRWCTVRYVDHIQSDWVFNALLDEASRLPSVQLLLITITSDVIKLCALHVPPQQLLHLYRLSTLRC